MSNRHLLGSLVAVPVLAMAFVWGCSSATDEEDVESAEGANTVAKDLATAREVIELLGGTNGKCKGCHNPSASEIRRWGNAMKAVDTACFAPTTMTAAQRVVCLKSGANFSPTKLGLYATGAREAQFKTLFEAAFPPSESAAQLATFTSRVAMPRGNRTPLTTAQFDKLKAWVLRGMPQLDQAAAGDAGTDSGADASDASADADGGNNNGCTETITSELKAHITAMKTTGWGARLADQATPMYGCGTATNALNCLSTHPDITSSIGATGITQKLRRLHQRASFSSYWVRSSADGRYIGFGGSSIVDLTKPATTPPIDVDAQYDPYFLPSNNGFAFAGAGASGDDIVLCKQSLIADGALLSPPSISLTGPKCTSLGSSVYESLGTSLDGVRYFMTLGAHVNDDGGGTQSSADFGTGAITTFTPIVNDGTAFRASASKSVTLAHEGDLMLSPSTLLATTRFAQSPTSKHGYRVRFVKAVQTGTSLGITTPLGGEYCLQGAKASLSFDERFLVTHQYVDSTQPDQAGLPTGSSNIVIVDLLTGAKRRITKMAANVRALYPHFRGDGWLYFAVRDSNTGGEYVVASDIAIRMSSGQ